MGAQLAGTVYVTDPDTHQTVALAPGTSPEPRLAALVTNPAAWVGGNLPRLPKATQGDPKASAGPTGDGQDGASGGTSDGSGTADQSTEADPILQGDADTDTKPAAKYAAKKTAARKPAAT